MVFLVYDSPNVDNQFFFQWPLGVAVYVCLHQIPHVNDAAQNSKVNIIYTIYSNPWIFNFVKLISLVKCIKST